MGDRSEWWALGIDLMRIRKDQFDNGVEWLKRFSHFRLRVANVIHRFISLKVRSPKIDDLFAKAA